MSEAKKVLAQKDPYAHIARHNLLLHAAVEEDNFAILIHPKKPSVITVPQGNTVSLAARQSPIAAGVASDDVEAQARMWEELKIYEFNRRYGLHQSSFEIDAQSFEPHMAKFMELLSAHENSEQLTELLDKICIKKETEFDANGDVVVSKEDGEESGKMKPTNVLVEDAAKLTPAEGLARFLPLIADVKMFSGSDKGKGKLPCYLLAKHLVGLPDELPTVGSKEAIDLFNDLILAKLIAVSDVEISAILNSEDGLVMARKENVRVDDDVREKEKLLRAHADATVKESVGISNATLSSNSKSITSVLDDVHNGRLSTHATNDDGTTFTPNFDIYASMCFNAEFPDMNEWSDSIDQRLLTPISSRLLHIVTCAASKLLGAQDTWPPVLAAFLATKGSNVDMFDLAKKEYETYKIIDPASTKKQKINDAATFAKNHYRNPSNVFYVPKADDDDDDDDDDDSSAAVDAAAGAADEEDTPAKSDKDKLHKVLTIYNVAERSKVEQQCWKVGKHDADVHTAPSFLQHLKAVEELFNILMKVDGAIATNQLFEKTSSKALTSRGKRKVEVAADADDDDDDDVAGDSAGSTSNKRVKLSDVNSKVDELTQEVKDLRADNQRLYDNTTTLKEMLVSLCAKLDS